jgi:hypothetical protein
MVFAGPQKFHEGFAYCCWVRQNKHLYTPIPLIFSRRTLPLFLQDGIDSGTLLNNRARALNFLRTLSDDGELRIQETCVLAWGQIARQV